MASRAQVSFPFCNLKEICNVSIDTYCKYSSLSSCYVAATHSVYAVLLAPRLIQALTYSVFALSCSILFQLFLDAPSQALLSASLATKAGPCKCRFKTPFAVSTCVRKRASHEARLFLPSPICHSTSIFCLILSRDALTDVENTPVGSRTEDNPSFFNLFPPQHTQTHTDTNTHTRKPLIPGTFREHFAGEPRVLTAVVG